LNEVDEGIERWPLDSRYGRANLVADSGGGAEEHGCFCRVCATAQMFGPAFETGGGTSGVAMGNAIDASQEPVRVPGRRSARARKEFT